MTLIRLLFASRWDAKDVDFWHGFYRELRRVGQTFGPSRTPSAKDDSRNPIRTCSPKTAIHHPAQMTHWLSSACLVRAPWVPIRDVNDHRLYQDHGSQSQRSTSSLARPQSRPWTRISVAIHYFPGTVVANHSHAMLGNKTGNKQ